VCFHHQPSSSRSELTGLVRGRVKREGLRAPDEGDLLPEFLHCTLEQGVSTLSQRPSFFALTGRGTCAFPFQGPQRRRRHQHFLRMRFLVGAAPIMEYAVLRHVRL
jgi:hypothetical protein